MRKASAMAASLLLLGLVWQAEAQPTLTKEKANSFLTGVNPHQLNFKPVDVSKFNKVFNASKALHKPASMGTFNTSSFFPTKLTLGTWPPRYPKFSILPQSQNPFQPSPAGKNPFSISPKK